MYPRPSEKRPFLWGMVDKSELTKTCIVLSHNLSIGDDAAKEQLGIVHTAITTCPAMLEEVKNFEIVGITLSMMADCIAQDNVHTAQLKRDLLCMSYFCYSSHMRYYECVCEAIRMRAELMLSKRDPFNSIIRSILHIVNSSIFEEKKLVEVIINKMVFADLSYAASQSELDEDYKAVYYQLKSIFANMDENAIIREGDALHKHMFDTLTRLYLKQNEFSYLSLE